MIYAVKQRPWNKEKNNYVLWSTNVLKLAEIRIPGQHISCFETTAGTFVLGKKEVQ